MIYKPKRIGTWYDSDYVKQVYNFIYPQEKNARAIIVPHAGLRYSGQTAGMAYSLVNWSRYNSIVILCTLHRSSSNLFLPPFDMVDFPGRIMEIDRNKRTKLLSSNLFERGTMEIFNEEHSFEQQLPFIMTLANPGTKILPILVGNLPKMDKIVPVLNSIIDDKTLIIITTDFTHYGPRFDFSPKPPVGMTTKEFIEKKDKKDINAILNNDVDTFDGIRVCGKYAIILWLNLNPLLNLSTPKLINYDTSSDQSNPSEFVCYASIAYSNKQRQRQRAGSFDNIVGTVRDKFTSREPIDILELAKGNILNIPRLSLIILDQLMTSVEFEQASTEDKIKKVLDNVYIRQSNLRRKGIFITHEVNLELQGCIGIFYDAANDGPYGLIETIIRYTIITIFDDGRFPFNPLRKKINYKALGNSKIHSFKINFLEKNISYPNNVFWKVYKPCKDGIILIYKDRSVTFLPSVMSDQGWIDDCDKPSYERTNEERDAFEKNTFGALLSKMGVSESWLEVKRSGRYEIKLYESNEFDDSKLDQINKFLEYYYPKNLK